MTLERLLLSALLPAILAVGCARGPEADDLKSVDPESVAGTQPESLPTPEEQEIIGVLDAFMDAFNALDIEAWEATFHFPHYRLASDTMHVLERPGEQSADQLRAYLEAEDWHHSEWLRREILHLTETKAHVNTTFARYREDDSLIREYDSLYVLTREDGRWGVKLRSSFAR